MAREVDSPRPDGCERIAAAFRDAAGRAALMPYLLGGYPDLETSRACLVAAVEAGADLVELGIPFSDPLADGPVIHHAATLALERGVTPGDVLALAASVAERVPVVVMVYANVVFTRGTERFLDELRAAGVAGLIVPDLPFDEAAVVRAAADERGLALVPLCAPTTPDDRLRVLAAGARGFVYAVSLTGTTGERDALPPGLDRFVAHVRSLAPVPVAVGFGVSRPEQAARVAEIADGVIVGSRIVRAAGEGGTDAVRTVVSELAAAVAAVRQTA
ncbi:Tryptophan synthase alpha chain [bacterium HR41]|nr:Tryptophan synthase alpha chain [bacterium HR41]